MSSSTKKSLAGIDYAGVAGSSADCKDAVLRLIQFGDRITLARILSCSNNHCLLLTINVGDLIAIKSGFASGYKGEGPRTFSYILQLLNAHSVEIEEFDVSKDIIERVNMSSLTMLDIDKLDSTHPIRPSRWHDYIYEKHYKDKERGTLWESFPPVIPYAIIDNRIIDLAIRFWENPDASLQTAYRRLEDIIRERTGIDESSTKLFSQAFLGPTAKLSWKDIDSGEQDGRASLFTALYRAYRNPRAHHELKSDANGLLAEFLLLNQLYHLEQDATECAKNRQVDVN